MIRLITEERFNSSSLEGLPRTVVKGVKNPEFLSKEWPYYKVDQGGYVIWIRSIKSAVVYGDIDIEKETIDLSDWKLEKLSDIPSKDYILNKMKEHVYLDHEFYKVCDRGDWKISNSITHEEINFTIKTSGDYYITTAIGYPEKNQDLIRLSDIIKKDKLIEAICYGIRKINKGSNLEG